MLTGQDRRLSAPVVAVFRSAQGQGGQTIMTWFAHPALGCPSHVHIP